MKTLKRYTVRNSKTGKTIVYGSAQECADHLSLKIGSFYYAFSRQKTGRVKNGKYIITAEKAD